MSKAPPFGLRVVIRCIVFTLALLLVGSVSDASPTHAEGPALQRLTRADGLGSNGVTALASDGETLYIGTLAGLDRLRGGVVTRVDAPLPDQHVTALLSHRGVLWVGTGAGLARRASGGAWESWTGGEAGLTNAWITSVAPGGWVGTYGGGVLRFREQNPGGAAPRFAPIGRHGPTWITALAADGDEVWAGTTGEGLWHWDGTRWARFRVPGEVGAEAVTALVVGARQHVWVGTRGGLWLFEPGHGWRPALIAQPIRALAYGSSGLLVAAGQTLYLSATGDLPDSFSAEASWTQVAAGLHGIVSALEADTDATWLATLGGGLQRLGTPVEVHSARLPVVLVHGYSDAPRVYLSQFHFLARWLRQDGWPVFYASGLAPHKPLLDNAASLSRTIAAVRAQTGAERVLLVAHSFGGLTARVYVGSDLYQDDVAGLVTLGTPHAGVRLVYDFLARDLANGDRRPATAELLPEHIALIERFLAERDVPTLAIAGNRLPDGVLLAGLPASDGLITTASALALSGATRTARRLAHGWTPSLLAVGADSYLFPDRLYHDTIRPWLAARAAALEVGIAGAPDEQQTGSAAASPARALTPALPLPQPGQTREPLASKRLAPGEVITVPFSIAADEVVHLFLTWDRGTFAFDLVEPDGTRHEHDRSSLRDDLGHLELGAGELRPLSLWSIRARTSGKWLALIRNRGAAPAEAHLDAIRPGGPALDLVVESGDPDGGARVRVQAEGRARPLAIIADARLSFEPSGRGESSAEVPLPATPGYYPVEVTAGPASRWAILVRPDRAAAPSASLRRLQDGEVIVTGTVSSSRVGRYALGLELWVNPDDPTAPTEPPAVRRLSAAHAVGPQSVARIVWHIPPSELPQDTTRLVVRVTALNAGGALLPGRERILREGTP